VANEDILHAGSAASLRWFTAMTIPHITSSHSIPSPADGQPASACPVAIACTSCCKLEAVPCQARHADADANCGACFRSAEPRTWDRWLDLFRTLWWYRRTITCSSSLPRRRHVDIKGRCTFRAGEGTCICICIRSQTGHPAVLNDALLLQ